MNTYRTTRHDTLYLLSAIALGLGIAGLATGLTGCASPTDVDPEPAGGGQQFVLDRAAFDNTVAPVLSAQGCDNITCHGGGIRGTFELSPDSNKNLDLDFAQAVLQVNGSNPETSSLLVKPLDESAGGLAHAGGAAFTYTNDAGYQTILAWIVAGEFK